MIIGLTGGIATGKSTVSRMLLKRGFPIVDADKIARQVVEPGEEPYRKITEVFGLEILTEDQVIDRKKLGSIIFQNDAKRQQLNDIVHPAVRNEMKEQMTKHLEEGHKTVILDIPLLIESKLMFMVDKIIVVYVPKSVQLQRLMERDKSSETEALSRISSQIPIEEKKEYASSVIDNSGSIKETEKQLDKLLKKWDITV